MWEIKGIPPDYLVQQFGWPIAFIEQQRHFGQWTTRMKGDAVLRITVCAALLTMLFSVVFLLVETISIPAPSGIARESALSHDQPSGQDFLYY